MGVTEMSGSTLLVPRHLMNHQVHKDEVRHFVSPNASPKPSVPKKKITKRPLHRRGGSLPNVMESECSDLSSSSHKESRWLSSSNHEPSSLSTASTLLSSSSHQSTVMDEVPKSPRPLGKRGGETERDLQGSRHGKQNPTPRLQKGNKTNKRSSKGSYHRRSSIRPSREASIESECGKVILEKPSDDQSIDLEGESRTEKTASATDSLLFGDDSYVGFMPLEGSSSSRNVNRCNSSLTMSAGSLNYSDNNLNQPSTPKKTFQSVTRHQKRRRCKKTGALLTPTSSGNANHNSTSLSNHLASSLSSVSMTILHDESVSSSSFSNHSDSLPNTSASDVPQQPPPPPPLGSPMNRWTASSPLRAELPPAFRGLSSPTSARRSYSNNSVPAAPLDLTEKEKAKEPDDDESYIVDDRLPPAFQNMARMEHRRSKENKIAASAAKARSEVKINENGNKAGEKISGISSGDGDSDGNNSFAEEDGVPVDAGIPPAFRAALSSPKIERKSVQVNVSNATESTTPAGTNDDSQLEKTGNSGVGVERSPSIPEPRGQTPRQEPFHAPRDGSDQIQESAAGPEPERATKADASLVKMETTKRRSATAREGDGRESGGRPPRQEPFYFAPENIEEIQLAVMSGPSTANNLESAGKNSFSSVEEMPERERKPRGRPPRQEPFYTAPDFVDQLPKCVALPQNTESNVEHGESCNNEGIVERKPRGKASQQEQFHAVPKDIGRILDSVTVPQFDDEEMPERKPRGRPPQQEPFYAAPEGIEKILDSASLQNEDRDCCDNEEMPERKPRGRPPKQEPFYAAPDALVDIQSSLNETEDKNKRPSNSSMQRSINEPRGKASNERKPRGRPPLQEPFTVVTAETELIQAFSKGSYDMDSVSGLEQETEEPNNAGEKSSNIPTGRTRVASTSRKSASTRGEANEFCDVTNKEIDSGLTTKKEPRRRSTGTMAKKWEELYPSTKPILPSSAPTTPQSRRRLASVGRRSIGVFEARYSSLSSDECAKEDKYDLFLASGSGDDYATWTKKESDAKDAEIKPTVLDEPTEEKPVVRRGSIEVLTDKWAEELLPTIKPRALSPAPGHIVGNRKRAGSWGNLHQRLRNFVQRPESTDETTAQSQATGENNGIINGAVSVEKKQKQKRRGSTGALVRKWEKLMKGTKSTSSEESNRIEPKAERRGSTGNMTEIVQKKKQLRKERKEKRAKNLKTDYKKNKEGGAKSKEKKQRNEEVQSTAGILGDSSNMGEPTGGSPSVESSDSGNNLSLMRKQSTGEDLAEGSSQEPSEAATINPSKRKTKKKPSPTSTSKAKKSDKSRRSKSVDEGKSKAKRKARSKSRGKGSKEKGQKKVSE